MKKTLQSQEKASGGIFLGKSICLLPGCPQMMSDSTDEANNTSLLRSNDKLEVLGTNRTTVQAHMAFSPP